MKYVLEVKNLKKRYGSITTVDGVSFSVKTGEIFGILGPNGAGKTTTLEMIEALRSIDGGTATLAGLDVAEQPNRVKEIIGVQLQSSSFFDNLYLGELLRMFGGLYSQQVDVARLLDEVQLGDKIKSQVGTLSGGQKQRFSVAAALVNNPKILFLD